MYKEMWWSRGGGERHVCLRVELANLEDGCCDEVEESREGGVGAALLFPGGWGCY